MEYPNTFQLAVTFEPANATDKRISYASDNTDVAMVDENGLITAVGVGACVITVKSLENDSIAATCAITVEQKQVTLEGLKLNIAEKTLYITPVAK